VLYRALGQNDTVEVDTLTRRLPPHSYLLLCSDGLWNQVSENEILDLVTKHPAPQEACNKLIALANMRGGIDNVTTILLKLPG
jgi:protein phosphatase